MKITSIELYELRVPLNKPFTRSVRIGTLVDCTPVVCRIVTDDGLEGIGETNPVMPLTSEDAAVVVHVIREHLAPAVLRAIPGTLMTSTAHGRLLQAECPNDPRLACHDLLGKSGGLRVADMLGGVAHDRLPVMWTVGMDTPEANAEEAVAMRRQGFTSLMIKVAAGTVEQGGRLAPRPGGRRPGLSAHRGRESGLGRAQRRPLRQTRGGLRARAAGTARAA